MLSQSHLSSNDNDDNGVKLGAVDRFPSIYLKAEENPGKPRRGNSLMTAVRLVIVPNGVHYLQTRSVGSHSTSEREKKGKKKRM